MRSCACKALCITVKIWRVDVYLATLLALLSLSGSSAALAADEEVPEPPQARMLARAYGVGALAPGADDHVEVELQLRGAAIRIDFRGEHAPDAWLTTGGRGGRAWLVSERGNYVLPVADASGPYWYDPTAPCRTIGGRCVPAPGEFIDGRLAAGWRYDKAKGPDGTTTGTLWVDTATGLLLGYRGRVGSRGQERGMRARAVRFEAVPESVFLPPQGLRQGGVKGTDAASY